MSDSGRQIGDCKHARTPASCMDCLWERVAELEADNQRLKAGRLTEEEFQTLCHTLDLADAGRFRQGCETYQRKLFGDGKVDGLKAAEARAAELGGTHG